MNQQIQKASQLQEEALDGLRFEITRLRDLATSLGNTLGLGEDVAQDYARNAEGHIETLKRAIQQEAQGWAAYAQQG